MRTATNGRTTDGRFAAGNHISRGRAHDAATKRGMEIKDALIYAISASDVRKGR